MSYSVTVHFKGGSAPLIETADEVRENPTHLVLINLADRTIIPFANVLYVDVITDDDDSEFGDDAATWVKPGH